MTGMHELWQLMKRLHEYSTTEWFATTCMSVGKMRCGTAPTAKQPVSITAWVCLIILHGQDHILVPFTEKHVILEF